MTIIKTACKYTAFHKGDLPWVEDIGEEMILNVILRLSAKLNSALQQ
jgi:hypothetical protein